MQVPEYKILRAGRLHHHDFEWWVKSKLDDGWKLHGGFHVCGEDYLQAFTRSPEDAPPLPEYMK